MTNHVFRVADITDETPAIRSLRMVRADGRSLKPYPAGSHIDVVGPTGILRQYSLCMPPDDPESILIAVKRENDSRGGSAAMHEVKVGDHLKVSQPRSLLAIADTADRHMLIAGGIGITPLLSMAYALHSRGADFELHYFFEARADAAFVDLLETRAEFRGLVRLYERADRREQPRLLTAAGTRLTPKSHVYTCGPGGFMDQVREVLAPRVGEDQIHAEHFTAVEVDTAGDQPFVVELDTGETFDVPPGRSILGVLEDNDIEVFKSCEEGICGSCVSGLLEGAADHRDNCLTATDRQTQIALCVSRAKSDKLLIELY